MSQYIGQDIGGYRIIEPIGTGGMARVFKAYQPAFDRFIALKILPEHYADDETYLARFAQEAKIIARLEHRHILPVYDFGEDNGITYLAMRYLRGGTLKDILARSGGMLPLGETIRIIRQIASALDYAHGQGIIHRDVKPTNVLIDAEGDAYLMDFGIAKVLEGTSHLTGTGGVIGTPAYMSPEQGGGRPLDNRSDIYSLGVVLYQMLTGRVPYDADTPLAVIIAHEREPLPLPSDLNPDIPEDIERVIFKALAKNPDDRYATAGSMALALEQATAGLETMQFGGPETLLALSAALAESKPSDEVTRDVRRMAKRRPRERRLSPLAWIGIAAVVIAVVVGFIVLGSAALSASQEAADARATAAAMAVEGPTITPVPPVAPESAGGSGSVSAPGEGIALLMAEPCAEDDQYGYADLCLSDGRTGESASPLGLDGFAQIQQAGWSPDGSLIVFNACTQEALDIPFPPENCSTLLYTLDRNTGEISSIPNSNNSAFQAWSPDGEWIAFVNSEGIYVIRPDGTDFSTLLSRDGGLSWVEWSPDSQRLAYLIGETGPGQRLIPEGVWVMNRDGSEPHQILAIDELGIDIPENGDFPIAFTPDGEYVAIDLMEAGPPMMVDADCYLLPNGCDETSRAEIGVFNQCWMGHCYPQWGGEAPAAQAPLTGIAAQAQAFAAPILAAIAGSGTVEPTMH